jgi:uncharacterized membrane protein
LAVDDNGVAFADGWRNRMVVPGMILSNLNVMPPEGGAAIEQIVLRVTHFAAGITWIGLLYFFNLIASPVMAKCDPQLRSRFYAELMPRAMWWFRFSAVLTWLAGFRYFMILAKTDAINAGNPALMGRWLGIWLGCWVVAFAILMGLLQSPIAKNGWLLTAAAAIVLTAAAWLVLHWIAGPTVGNRTLSISVGGGLGTIMFLSVWGVVWRCQKKLIKWHRESVEHGTPMPPEAAKVARLSYVTARLNFWISFPMLFFMAAASHFPIFSGQ